MKRRKERPYGVDRIGCLICIGHFLHKSPMLKVSFAERDLQIKTSEFLAKFGSCVCLGV